MIGKLRRKFIIILMGAVATLLLAVFVSVLLSTWGNVRQLRENTLRQVLLSEVFQGHAAAPFRAALTVPEGQVSAVGVRITILMVELDGDHAKVLLNYLYPNEPEEIEKVIGKVADDPAASGILRAERLRWVKSEDGKRVAFADISMEQEMLRTLLTNSALVGSAAMLLFFGAGLLLSRWAVRPVEQAWERQRRFVADASHELKTPLTVILSNADMLSRPPQDVAEETAGSLSELKNLRRIEHIRAESARMKHLVEDLITLARSDGADKTMVRERVDLSFTVANTVLTYEAVLYDEKKTLSSFIKEGLFINGDARRLGQLTAILMDNARKYCPERGRVEVVLDETDKKALLLTVFNEGEAIGKEDLQQIFLRFYRADPSRGVTEGFGLGLSIAEGIVKEHGGKIWAAGGTESFAQPKVKGNRFFVSLPMA